MHGWRERTTVWLLLAVPAAGGFTCPAALAGPTQGAFASAEVCGRCHRDILSAWKSSVHARSMEDSFFQDCLQEAKSRFGEAVSAGCLACHAPTVAFSGDIALQYKVSWEGVTCDFCHSISQVDLQNVRRPYRLQIGAAKFGPLKNASSPGHAVSFSKVHTDPVVCAGCHDARNENGLMVLASYSEWLDSSFGSDRASCLDCHMRPVKGRVADPKALRLKDAAVNLHQMPGGHAVDQLNKALSARVIPRRDGDQLHVQVFIRNRGAGHMVPTGSPLRKLALSLEVHTGDGQRLIAERVYQRVIVDGKGGALADEPDAWIRGARVASDNRLKPNEERVEDFAFPVQRAQRARVQARFWYHYSPLAGLEGGKVEFLVLPAIVSP